MEIQISKATKVVVASTVMLSFISFWRAAAIVLCDLASSAFYAGGIAEGYVGKSAPWFILAIMLSSYAVRAIYIESCSMFVRGGVYRVVHEALGGLLAKFSVSALMFDYVLTGPISGVTAGLYLAGLINDSAKLSGHPRLQIEPQTFAAIFAIAVTIYFWRKNVIGIHESSQKALRIMQLTTLMVVILIGWCLATMAVRGFSPVPLPTLATIHFGQGSTDALGWLRGTVWPSISVVAILIGLGHSLLAMSGEESLAQVNREIASPKLANLKKAGFVIFIYSMLFTSLVSFFGVMLIPDKERVNVYLGNLISGLAMHMIGPVSLRLLFQAFVVVVGTVILAGWCLATTAVRGFSPVPLPTLATIHFGQGSTDALGWLRGTVWPSISVVAILIGLGHSLLAMSGEESLAQVNREIASPKLANLKKAGFVIFIYSMLFTSLVSFFGVMLIPDKERVNVYLGNLISGLAMHMIGPVSLRLLFQAFVVVVGTVILAGAVNTAIVGSNGVLNRVAEDGVLPDWFRQPHRKFGTTSRIIGLIVVLQIVCVILSRGDLLLLGDAYAFGVVWSFAMKALSVLVLRFRQPGKREWKVPLNFHVRGIEIPVGLALIFVFLFVLAFVNLFTKQTATIWGFGFTVAIFTVFEISERYNRRHNVGQSPELEKFRLDSAPELSTS
ncbi:MAG: hypothetical protein DMG57_16400 [Acidobacteria bacterium]|nr:MAG: hypothetical protein DMG57_16400 [Acidobacteriota bacterium]